MYYFYDKKTKLIDLLQPSQSSGFYQMLVLMVRLNWFTPTVWENQARVKDKEIVQGKMFI